MKHETNQHTKQRIALEERVFAVRKEWKFAAVILLAYFVPAFCIAQIGGTGGVAQPPTPEFNMDKFIHKVTERFKDANNPVAGYQVVFVKDGNLYYSESGGASIYEEDNGSNDIPMFNTTRQNVSSVSKFISTLVLANVLEEYGIDWDEPVSDYLHETWVVNMAPEHSDSLSPCYLTFEQLVRHRSCLDFGVEGNSGPNPNNMDMAAYLSVDSINMTLAEDFNPNLFDYNDYRNGNFTLTRILIANIWAINNIGFDITIPTVDPPLTEFDSADIYYSLVNQYIYLPLGIGAPISNNALEAFHNSSAAPRAHQFPFNRDSLTCGGNLGWMAGNPAAPNSAGGSGLVLNTMEMAEIVAFFKNDNNETIISNAQRDYILNNDLGLAANEVTNGQTAFGDFYFKNGTRGPGCPGGSAPNAIQRATMSFIAMYPNNVELVMLTNSRINFRTAAARDWEDCWEINCGSVVHTVAEASMIDNKSKIENVSTDGDPDKLLFITLNRTPQSSAMPSPVGVNYENDKWHIYRADGASFVKGTRFNVLAFDDDYPLAFEHTHVSGTQTGNVFQTVLNHPELNDNPDAKLLVTQKQGSLTDPTSGLNIPVINNSHIGVDYNGTNWVIFNQDLSPIPDGASFNILFDHNIVEETVISPVGNFSEVSLASIGSPDRSQLLFTTNSKYPNANFNDTEVAVFYNETISAYSTDRWHMVNLPNPNANNFNAGTKVNLLKMEDCECCGTDEVDEDNVEFVGCTDPGVNPCNTYTDTIPCAEDFVLFIPEAYDQCRTYTPELDEVVLSLTNPIRSLKTEFSLDYFGEEVDGFIRTYVLDTIPPEMIGVPEDMIVSCTVPPIPEVIIVNDNCTQNIIPDFIETTEGVDCNFKITRTFSAVDSMGNETVKSYCIYSGSYTDQDNDGSSVLEDCDDNDPTVYPGANELCDGMDNDCNGQSDENCMDCIADNFINAPIGLFEDQTVAGGSKTTLKWTHYSDASDACILRGALSDGVTNIGPFGQILIQGPKIQGNIDGHDVSADLLPNASYTLFNPLTFPAGNTNSLVPGALYMWQTRCGCVIDASIPLPDRLDGSNIHLSPWSEFSFFTNLSLAPGVEDDHENSFYKNTMNDEEIAVYPNPSDGIIRFMNLDSNQEIWIRILDVRGRIIFNQQFQGSPAFIEVDGYNEGLHFVQLTTETFSVSHKIVLQ